MTQQTRASIDQLLQEQGEYRPLDFLLREGRLSREDYEAWRNGEIDRLDEMLFGDPGQIMEQLQEAADYLRQLGWVEDRLEYHHQGRPGLAPLRFSDHALLNQLFHQPFHKPVDQAQMDLFFDSVETTLFNDTIHHLLRCSAATARASLEQLTDRAPDHAHLGELERLVEALESLTEPVIDPAAELRSLQQQLTPLAEALLGRECQTLLIPLWTRLSQALSAQPFVAEQPELHQSHAAIQARDWALTRQAVERAPGWQEQPHLIRRRALACEHLRQPATALHSWFILCWYFPDQASAIQSGSNGELRTQWRNFQELEPELPAEDFPAWLLIASPRLIQSAPDPHQAPPCPPSYTTLYQLRQITVGPHGGIDKASLGLRADLQRQAPLLLRHLLDAISGGE